MKRSTGEAVLMLDEILRGLTDEDITRITAGIRKRDPQWADQMDAAIDHARSTLFIAESGWAGTTSPGSLDDCPAWVRLGMFHALVTWMKDEGRTCLDAPIPGRPQPVFAAAWKPGLVVCGRCIQMLAARGVQDRTCDGCGHVTTGPANNDGIYPAIAQFGAFTYEYGVCQTCKHWDD